MSLKKKKKNSDRIARVDRAKCTLCEVCIRHCPNTAYRLDRKDETIMLLFSPAACDGCPDRVSCVEKCPEKAIAFEGRSKSVPTGEQVIVESRMLKCAYCGEHFSSTERVESVAKRLSRGRDVERSYCPLCRRTRLVVNLIETERAPGSKAEYRSGKDMLRRSDERKKKTEKKP